MTSMHSFVDDNNMRSSVMKGRNDNFLPEIGLGDDITTSSSVRCLARMATPRKKIDRVWEFNVSDPKMHQNGFTIYKVTCKVFPINIPENLTEVVIWKRYNDFKLLHKTLSSLHKNLHRKEEFPEFARPKVFGRFDEDVIEERRQSALSLLQFVGRNYHLYRSMAFLDFFKGGEKANKLADHTGKILRPVKLDVVPTPASVPPLSTQQENTNNQTVESGKDEEEIISASPEMGLLAADTDNDIDELSSTLWNLPQVPDNVSLNSFDGDDDPDLTDVESALSTPLPEADISFFDPLKTEPLTPESDLAESNTWLLSAFHTCANIETNSDIQTPVNEEQVDNQFSQDLDNQNISEQTNSVQNEDGEKTVEQSEREDLTEFDPLKSRSSSKVECGKGDLDLSSRSPSITSSSSSEQRGTNVGPSTPSPRKHVKPTAAGSPRHRTQTGESVTDMDLGGQYDYIYIAAHQISRAQESEAAGNYEMAHAYYMSGVGVLLQGVQSDTNKARREAVKRKTAKYLMRVEDLSKRYLTNESLMSPDVEIDPSLAYLKGPSSELKYYKVLGTVGKVLLVFDRATDTTYVIKTLHKSEGTPFPRRPAIVPTSCPYMVQFLKFYETDNAVYMLLQYASGGKLWNYIGAYLQHNNSSGLKGGTQICEAEGNRNIYTGHKVENHETNTNGNADHNRESVLYSATQCALGDDNKENNCDIKNSENKNRSLSPDICSSAYVELFSAQQSNQAEDEPSDKLTPDVRFTNTRLNDTRESNDVIETQSTPKPGHSLVNRNCSLTSDDGDLYVSQTPTTADKSTPNGEHFGETLHSTKRSLENFSIGSFDDGELFHRQDSGLSDHITSIPEESEVLPDGSPTSDTDFTAGETEQTASDIIDDLEAQRIVQNTKELLESVEKSLQESESPCLNISEIKSDSTEIFDSAKESSSVNVRTVPDSSHKLIKSKDRHRSSSGTRKGTNIIRMNSKELCRSASFENDLKSPSKGRTRTISSVFEQLDTAASINMEIIKIPETCIKQWAAEIVVCLNSLHSMGIICRDLNPDNILLGDRGHVLLTYFSQWSNADQRIDEECIEQLYVAPEVRGINGFTEVCDWWSLGALLYELLVGKSLLSGHPGGVTSHTQLLLPAHLSPEASALLEELLRHNPRERLGSGITGVEEIKSHPFFSGIDWASLTG